MMATTAFSRTIRSQPGLTFLLGWVACAGRRMARAVEVDGDIVTVTLAGGQVRRWDMNLARSIRVSRAGAEVRFATMEPMWIPWGAFAERDRRWMMTYVEQQQVSLARRHTRAARLDPPHD